MINQDAARPQRIHNYELIRLIGEIDSVEFDNDCKVYLNLKGRKICIMNDTDFINREGIREILETNLNK